MVTAPQVVLHGDRCPPVGEPIVRGAQSDADLIPEVRSQLFLEWPGACACQSPDFDRQGRESIEICGLFPRSAPFKHQRVAVAPDGTSVIFGDGFADRVARDGTRRQIVGRPRTSHYFAAGSLDGTSFWLSSETDGIPGEYVQFDYFDASLTGRTVVGRPDITPRVVLDLEPGRQHLLGGRPLGLEGEQIAVMSCAADSNGELDCADEAVHGFDLAGHPTGYDAIHRAARLANGMVVAATDRHQVLIRPTDGPPWRSVFRFPAVLEVVEGGATVGVELREMRTTAAIGDRVVSCFDGRHDGDAIMIVVTASVAAATGASLTAPNFDMLEVRRNSTCHGVVRRPARGTVLLSLARGEALEVDGAGDVVGRYDGIGPGPGTRTLPDLDIALRTVDEPRPGWIVGTDPADRLHLGQGDGPFEVIYGPAEPQVTSYSALTVSADGGGFLALGAQRVPLWIRAERGDAGCDALDVVPLVLDGLDSTLVPTAAVATSTGILVAGTVDRVPTLWTVAADDSCTAMHRGAVRATCRDDRCCGRPVMLDGLADHSTLVDLAPLDPHRLLAVGESGELLLVAAGRVEALEVQWDDPTTATSEGPVREVQWTAVGAAEGIGWAAATETPGFTDERQTPWMARVVPGLGGAPRAEGFWLAKSGRPTACDDTVRFEPLSVEAYCPHRVAFTAKETLRVVGRGQVDHVGSAWLLRPASDQCSEPPPECRLGATPTTPLRLCEDRRVRDSDMILNGQTPIALFGDTGTPVYLLRTGEFVANVERTAYNRVPLGVIHAAASNGRGVVIATGGYGRIVGALIQAAP